MHKGMMMESIRLLGRAGHSSNPALGVSALEGMYEVMAELLAWRKELQREFQDARFEVPVPTLNLGRVHGGDSPNRICAECCLDVDLRPLPNMNVEALRARLRERLSRRLLGSGLQLQITSLFPGTPPMETPADGTLVQVIEELSGYQARAVAFCTEAPFLQRLGAETVIFGPGDVAQAHQPDEYLALDRIEPMVEILTRLILRLCVGTKQ
jgi:acetylornithine deacetylase